MGTYRESLTPKRGGGDHSHVTPKGIEQQVIRITASFPHGETPQFLLLDKLTFGSRGRRIVKRDHDLSVGVVDIGGLGAIIEAITDA